MYIIYIYIYIYISANKKYHKNIIYKLNQIKTENENINFEKETFILIAMICKDYQKSSHQIFQFQLNILIVASSMLILFILP